jgi:hypothetical protein
MQIIIVLSDHPCSVWGLHVIFRVISGAFPNLNNGWDGWIVSGGVALLPVGHKTGLMCTTVYL